MEILALGEDARVSTTRRKMSYLYESWMSAGENWKKRYSLGEHPVEKWHDSKRSQMLDDKNPDHPTLRQRIDGGYLCLQTFF